MSDATELERLRDENRVLRAIEYAVVELADLEDMVRVMYVPTYETMNRLEARIVSTRNRISAILRGEP